MKEKDCIIVTADNGLTLVVMAKQNTSQIEKPSYKTTAQLNTEVKPIGSWKEAFQTIRNQTSSAIRNHHISTKHQKKKNLRISQ